MHTPPEMGVPLTIFNKKLKNSYNIQCMTANNLGASGSNLIKPLQVTCHVAFGYNVRHFDCKYLRNGSRHRQSENDHEYTWNRSSDQQAKNSIINHNPSTFDKKW